MKWPDASLLIACALMVAAIAWMVGAPTVMPACSMSWHEKSEKKEDRL